MTFKLNPCIANPGAYILPTSSFAPSSSCISTTGDSYTQATVYGIRRPNARTHTFLCETAQAFCSKAKTEGVPSFELTSKMSFSDYLNRYNEAIFHRWTHQLAIIAEKAARSELASRAADKAAGIKPSIIRRRSPPRLPLWELDNTMVDLEPPLSETE
ncbi:MAG: hypothetical protein KKE11_04345, partial [Gammaproteobacteria bacterium]|nr:hypothetical protein [Gammaproteobacteria bacterium]